MRGLNKEPIVAGNALTPIGLDSEYRAGKWDFINALDEQARQGIVAAWLVACDALESVLDVGCGEANLCRYLLAHGLRKYLGTDLSEAALAAAAGRYPKARFAKADFNTFEPAPGERFSAILFNEVLSYTEEQARQIARYRQWVRPGGIMVVSMYAPARASSGAHAEIARVWEATQGEGWTVLDDVVLTSRAKNVTWKLRLVAPG